MLEQNTYPLLFLLLLAEESGLPLPGDGTMMFAGYRVAEGYVSFVPAFLVMEAGTLIGTSFLWWLGGRGGRPLVHRYGRYIHLDERRLARAERWFARKGAWSIVLGRLVPGLRITMPFVAGVLEVPYRVFLPCVAVGSSIFMLVFMSLGLGLGREAWHLVELIWPNPMMLIPSTVVLVGIVLLALRLRRKLQMV